MPASARLLHAAVEVKSSLSVYVAVVVISKLIWMGTAEQVVLLDTTKLNHLGWQTFPSGRNTLRGWKEASYSENGHAYRVYFACDVTRNVVNNWVRLPYIERGIANRLHIEVRFTVRKCTKHTNPRNIQQCRETFKLLYYEADSDFGNSQMPTWDTLTYKHIDVIAADETFIERSKAVINTKRRSVPVTKKGVYFAFYDQGTCATLISIKVYYIMCPSVTLNFATFPNTSAGSEEAGIVQKRGSCVPNAVMGDQPKYLCSADGKWSFLEGHCICKPGYEPKSDQACTACKLGYYKWQNGGSSCSPCPANSNSDKEGMAECPCDATFYRSPKDSKSMPCTKPPSEPENVTVVHKDQTTINLVWRRPQSLGGRADLSYRVECEPCDSAVAFFPKQFGFNTTSVSIQGLNPDTLYHITVCSENGVTASSKQKIFTTVKVRTIPSALSKIEKVRVVNIGVNYITLSWEWTSQKNSGIIVYEVRWYPVYKKYSVHREDTRQSNLTFSNLERNTEYAFQVRGQTNAGWGEYSDRITVKTLDNGPLHKPILSDDEDDQQQPITIIAGAIVAVVLCMAIVIIMVIIFLKRYGRWTFSVKRNNSPCNRKALDVSDTNSYGQMYGDMSYPTTEYPPMGNGTMTIPLFSPPGSLRAYVDPYTYEDPNQAVREFTKEIDVAYITIETVIGGGEFGDVCKGWLQVPGQGQLCVAIKTLKTGASDKNRLDFLTEASIMGQFDDPNVIYLEGVVTKSHPIMIVTEFMENGSLDAFLRNNDGKFTLIQLTGMMRGIASGMRYLSDMGYVHRDLAARNILVSSTLVCKVADFGLSREIEFDSSEGAYTTRGGKIPVKWTAPEAIAYRKFTSSSDVWSYAVVMWEIVAYGERPYWNWSNQDVIKALEKGYRLPPPMECPESVYKIMLDCWQRERSQRPKFATIVKTVDKLIRTPELLTKQAEYRPYYNFVDSNLPYISSTTSVQDWLFSLKMERYIENFLCAGYTVMHQVAALNISDLVRLGITLVGHQKKLMNGIQSLRAHLDDNCSQGMIV